MNSILVINKPKNVTSRDVVNKICKVFGTKKVGHTGTLDPIATGVLILCIGKATKLVETITNETKEYIATVKLGVLTDSLDITGNVLEQRNVNITKSDLETALNSFVGKYNQEVPAYSAIKVNGKKLYQYARENKDVKLPSREVEIKEIELLKFDKDYYTFRAVVSKGTYIRSLIRDINNKQGIIGVMSDLVRTKQGRFVIENSFSIDDIESGNYALCSVKEALSDYESTVLDDSLYKKVINGSPVNNVYQSDYIVFIYNDEPVAIYKKYDSKTMKPYKMLIWKDE